MNAYERSPAAIDFPFALLLCEGKEYVDNKKGSPSIELIVE